MHHDIFDVYRGLVHDANDLAARRLGQDTQFISLVTFLLGGDGYIALVGGFRSWGSVAISLGFLIIGWVILDRWKAAITDAEAILDFRYGQIRNLEQDPQMVAMRASYYSHEYATIYAQQHERQLASQGKSFRARTNVLIRLFRGSFVIVLLFLFVATLFHRIPVLADWYHSLSFTF